MKKRDILITTGIGFVLGYCTRMLIKYDDVLTPERALKQAKQIFGDLGPINGSWIYMYAETIERNDLPYHVYHGGITRKLADENVPYDFYIDVQTGAIIDAFPSK